MRRSTPTAILVLILLAACQPAGGGAGADASASESASTLTVEAAETDAGRSLVGPDGMTLYVFTQDTDGTSVCTDGCAETWPPFVVDAGTALEGGDGVSGELATIERDDGSTQVTYDGMPLYSYAEDAEPGDATGDGVNDVWFIADPDGAPAGSDDESDEAEPSDDDGAGDDEPSPTEEDDPYDYGT